MSLLRSSPAPATVAAATALLLVPFGTAAQEVTLSGGLGDSGFDALDRPGVVSVEVGVPVFRFFRVVGGWRRVSETGREGGTTCDSYWPGFEGCLQEPVETEARLTQWQFGLRAGLPLHPWVELHAGVARVRSRLDGSSEGVGTGRSAGDYFPEDEAVWDTALAAEARTGRMMGGHFRLRLLVQSHELDLQGCVTDVGTPFCGSERLTTVELGVVLTR